MPRLLVIEAEAGTRVPDLHESAWQLLEGQARRNAPHRLLAGLVRGQERIAGEQMFEVGEQQLLMLLLVIQSQDHAGGESRVQIRAGEEDLQVLIDVRSIGQHLGDRRSRQQATLWPAVHRTDRVVIRVEQVAELLVKEPITVQRAL